MCVFKSLLLLSCGAWMGRGNVEPGDQLGGWRDSVGRGEGSMDQGGKYMRALGCLLEIVPIGHADGT